MQGLDINYNELTVEKINDLKNYIISELKSFSQKHFFMNLVIH